MLFAWAHNCAKEGGRGNMEVFYNKHSDLVSRQGRACVRVCAFVYVWDLWAHFCVCARAGMRASAC